MGALSIEQRSDYETQGYLLVSGLIPESIMTIAQTRLREMVESGEVASGHGRFDESALTDCYTTKYIAAAEELTGESGFAPPTAAYIINVLPSPGPWKWPAPHIDHAIKEHGYKTFPRAFHIATMTFLSDVAQHGGGTVVWPGSHLKLKELAESDPQKYEFMWRLNEALETAELGEPIELTPRRGDVLFYHYLCAHAGSMNVTQDPRLAMNCKW